jgi:hypothetical protein
MNFGWLVIAVGVAVIGFLLMVAWRRRGDRQEMGSISDRWLAEQRLGRRQDPDG